MAVLLLFLFHILWQRRNRYEKKRLRQLFGSLCIGIGDGNSGCCDIPGRCIDVFGVVPADWLWLLLFATVKEGSDENRGVESAEDAAWNPAPLF